jgi:hypothetical protein
LVLGVLTISLGYLWHRRNGKQHPNTLRLSEFIKVDLCFKLNFFPQLTYAWPMDKMKNTRGGNEPCLPTGGSSHSKAPENTEPPTSHEPKHLAITFSKNF